ESRSLQRISGRRNVAQFCFFRHQDGLRLSGVLSVVRAHRGTIRRLVSHMENLARSGLSCCLSPGRTNAIFEGTSPLFQNKLLNTGAGGDLARVHVPLRIYRDALQRLELSGFAARPSELAGHRTVIAVQNPDDVVRPVSDEHVSLFWIMRKGDSPGRSGTHRL